MRAARVHPPRDSMSIILSLPCTRTPRKLLDVVTLAARYAASIADEPLKAEAVALAEELEQWAEG